MLHVHEREPGLMGEPGRGYEIVGKAGEGVVRQHHGIAGATGALVEIGMAIDHERSGSKLVRRLGIAARMGQLQTDQ